ncbi:HAMP domain-containing histidine kinase [bacterium]|nr:MAG: HAMP domain-containing histidine kinase [bacterium]
MAIRFSFRTKIILVFSFITIGLAMIMSRVSYYTVKEIYLSQLSDQLLLTTRIVMSRFSGQYLRYLNPLEKNTLAASYYADYLNEQQKTLQLESVSIFNVRMQTLISTDSLNGLGGVEPILLMHRTEIENLQKEQFAASLPFKGEDGRWYLWGFYRIDGSHWLYVRENADRMAGVEELSLIFWGIGLSGVTFTLIGGWFLARTLARPIDKLVHFSRELGKGEWETPVPQDIKGELASLSYAMHLMRENLVTRQKEKETILAHIAHEIRNPLGGIELFTGLIKEDIGNTQKNTEYIQKILDEIGGLKSLINNYLNFGRPSVANPENVVIADAVTEVLHVLQNMIKEKNITIQSQAEASMRFDKNHLRHILINVLTNAVQAVDPGGHISISFLRKGNENQLTISDDGPGIRQDTILTVFEPFFTTHSNGTGLGLAICKKLCEENGASISVKNNPAKGCTFMITTFGTHD